ncbi:MAG: glycosyltransferase family 39 protein [Acidobacteria bacterium]|nr:glycosyltransferase family 39 protein [Acidobacteriota bacterium]
MQTTIPDQTRGQDKLAARSPRPPFRRSVWFIVLVALALRLAVILVGHTYRINPRRDHFSFGWEMGRIARSLANGQGFSSPTDLDTGPSAWAAPVYPIVMAGVFRIFGVYTHASAFLMLAFNSVFASLTCWTLYRVGERVYNQSIGWGAAWTWAVFPYIVYWPVRIIWEVSFSAFLLSLALWLTIRMLDRSRGRDWLVYGSLWGLILLTNTTLAILLPFFLVWLFSQSSQTWRQLSGVAVALAAIALWVTPWIVRNHHAFGRFIFVRDNLPMELHQANNDASAGLWTRSEHPGNDLTAMQRFRELGEIAFMDEKKTQVQQFIRQRPWEFAAFTVKRVWYFWAAPPQLVVLGGYDLGFARHVEFLLAALFAFAGFFLTWRRRNRYRWLLAAFLSIYPLPYYLVNPFQRYKHPIEPVMLLLIVYLFGEAGKVQVNWRWRG